MLVHNSHGTKIGSHAYEGWWVGFNTKSEGHQVYWPNWQSITLEQNIIFPPSNIYLPEKVNLKEELSGPTDLEREHAAESNTHTPSEPGLEGKTNSTEKRSILLLASMPTPPACPKCVTRSAQYICYNELTNLT